MVYQQNGDPMLGCQFLQHTQLLIIMGIGIGVPCAVASDLLKGIHDDHPRFGIRFYKGIDLLTEAIGKGFADNRTVEMGRPLIGNIQESAL